MEEVVKKTHVQIGENRLLQQLSVVYPKDATLKHSLLDQLERCGVRLLLLDFRIEPVIEETGQEVDLYFTGDVTITLQCYAWGENKKGEQDAEEEKTTEPS